MAKATRIVHWPGIDTPACEEHTQKLLNLTHAMGFLVLTTPCEPTVCKNCENESKKAGK
jgi:hypothetical protein